MTEKQPPPSSSLEEPSSPRQPASNFNMDHAQLPHNAPLTPNSAPQQPSLNPPFTPRSASFPDRDSDSEFDHDPHSGTFTPDESPHADLPPSYEEAQAQARENALERARDQLREIDLRVHRMVLGPRDASAPASQGGGSDQTDRSEQTVRPDDVGQAPSYTSPEPLPPQYTSRGNVSRDAIPVQEAMGGGTEIPVHQIPSVPSPRSEPKSTQPPISDPEAASTMLLSHALDFTKASPDADARYAPRLSRRIAIPSEGVAVLSEANSNPSQEDISRTASNTTTSTSTTGSHRSYIERCSDHSRRRNRHGRRGHRHSQPDDASLKTDHSTTTAETPAPAPLKLARCYSKALHAHSISPAQFVAFLDGFNVLSHVSQNSGFDLITPYLAQANVHYFAPRGLQVRLTTLDPLLEKLNVSEARGQRDAVRADIISKGGDAERKAAAIEPYAEPITFDVPGMSGGTVELGVLGERIAGVGMFDAQAEQTSPATHQEAETRQQNDPEDPPVSIPGSFPPPQPSSSNNLNNPASASNPAQSWAQWGVQLGQHWERWGQDFGRRMERWGEDFGRAAEERAALFEQRVGGSGAGAARHQNPTSPGSSSSNTNANAAAAPAGTTNVGAGPGMAFGMAGIHVSAPGVNVAVPRPHWAPGTPWGIGHPWGWRQGHWGPGGQAEQGQWQWPPGQHRGRGWGPWASGPWERGGAGWRAGGARGRGGPWGRGGGRGGLMGMGGWGGGAAAGGAMYGDHEQAESSNTAAARGRDVEDENDDDDDAASISSLSSSSSSSSSSSNSSSSSSDSDDDLDVEKAEERYQQAVTAIESNYTAALSKGKRSATQLSSERDRALQKAAHERTRAELRHFRRQNRRSLRSELRAMKKQYRQESRAKRKERAKAHKKDLKRVRDKGFNKKSREYRDEKRRIKASRAKERKEDRIWWRERKGELRKWRETRMKEMADMEKDFARGAGEGTARGVAGLTAGGGGVVAEWQVDRSQEEVWLVVENLDD